MALEIVVKRLETIFGRLIAQAKEDEEAAAIIADEIDSMIENLANDDFFGTEGQSDPRGDMRDGAWDITNVQGVDDVTGEAEEEEYDEDEE